MGHAVTPLLGPSKVPREATPHPSPKRPALSKTPLPAATALFAPSVDFSPMRPLALCLLALLAPCLAGARVFDVASWETPSGGVGVHARADGEDLEVTLQYRINWDETRHEVPMTFSSGVWSVQVPTGPHCPPGALFRFTVVANSPGGVARTEGVPTVVSASALGAKSKLPIFWWYVSNPEAARSDTPTPGFVLFDARDGAGLRWSNNVTAHRSGSERHNGLANQWGKGKSKDWPKTNFAFKWHTGDAKKGFIWQPGRVAVSGSAEAAWLLASFSSPQISILAGGRP